MYWNRLNFFYLIFYFTNWKEAQSPTVAITEVTWPTGNTTVNEQKINCRVYSNTNKFYHFFSSFEEEKVSKSFIDVVQDFPRTALGIPVKTKTPSLGPYCRSWNRLSALNFTSDWPRLLVTLRLFHNLITRNPPFRLHAQGRQTHAPR